MSRIPAITPDYLKSQIVDVRYYRDTEFSPNLTTCVLKMANGFLVQGRSAVLDMARFDEQIGKDIAYKDAFEKLWELEGYARASLTPKGDYLPFTPSKNQILPTQLSEGEVILDLHFGYEGKVLHAGGRVKVDPNEPEYTGKLGEAIRFILESRTSLCVSAYESIVKARREADSIQTIDLQKAELSGDVKEAYVSHRVLTADDFKAAIAHMDSALAGRISYAAGGNQRPVMGLVHPGEAWMTPEAFLARFPEFEDRLNAADKEAYLTFVNENGSRIHLINSADPLWVQFKAPKSGGRL